LTIVILTLNLLIIYHFKTILFISKVNLSQFYISINIPPFLKNYDSYLRIKHLLY